MRAGRARTLDDAVARCASRSAPAAPATRAPRRSRTSRRSAPRSGSTEIVLYGVSYGTKVALDYAARYPQHVSRLVLDSVLLPGGSDPFLRTTIASIPRVLTSLCGARGCRFTRDPTADLRRLVARIARNGPLAACATTAAAAATASRSRARGCSRCCWPATSIPPRARVFPGAVRAALDGDTALLARMLSSGAGGLDASSDSERALRRDLVRGRRRAVAGRHADRRAPRGDDRCAAARFPRATSRRSTARPCDAARSPSAIAWPESPIAQPSAPLPDVPTLILSGDDDLRTPRSDALALARADAVGAAS